MHHALAGVALAVLACILLRRSAASKRDTKSQPEQVIWPAPLPRPNLPERVMQRPDHDHEEQWELPSADLKAMFDPRALQ